MSDIPFKEPNPARIGVSSCLLGNNVRYDGGNTYNTCIVELLQKHFQLEAFCPEVAIGLSIPRPPVQLVKTDTGVRALGVDNRDIDITGSIKEYLRSSQDSISRLDGFILKSKSPSCGTTRVKLFRTDNHFQLDGQGLFAQGIMNTFPHLPVVDENHCNHPEMLESFLQQVQVHHRWVKLLQQGITAESLLRFHTQHKYLLYSHHETRYRKLGRMIAHVGSDDLPSLQPSYIALVMETLKIPATRKKQANIFLHMLGHVKRKIPVKIKRELLQTIEQFRNGHGTSNALKNAFIRTLAEYPDAYLEKQYFLERLPEMTAQTSNVSG